MSKTNKNSSWSKTISVNGKPKIQTITDEDGNSTSNYIMSPWEKLAYEYAEKEFAENIDDLNVFSEETLKSLNEQVDAYTKGGIAKIDEIYSPMIKNLQNDVASRFGSLDNSIFLEKLDALEDKRAKSVAALSEDIKAKESELIEEELDKRYDYLNFLNNYQGQFLQNTSNNSVKGNPYSNNSSNSYSNLSKELEDITKNVFMSLFDL
ncbi:hypothetical protein IKA92_00815 [bacterium]|nr:hypothetical protein [bacterium]